MALEIPLLLDVEGRSYMLRTVLANREGVLVYSPKLCPRGSIVEVRNPANGQSAPLRVVWSWVENAANNRTIRLALEKVVASARLWDHEYARYLERAGLAAQDRRCRPRVSVRIPLEAEWQGARRRVETCDVSDRGAAIVSDEPYEPGTTIRLIRSEPARDAEFRVVWAHSQDPPRRFRIGMEMLGASQGFWGQHEGHA